MERGEGGEQRGRVDSPDNGHSVGAVTTAHFIHHVQGAPSSKAGAVVGLLEERMASWEGGMEEGTGGAPSPG